jgi:hypothetical protein
MSAVPFKIGPAGPYAVEKLLPAKFAKIKLLHDALQTTFSVFVDIFYPPNLGYLEETDFFNPRLITSSNYKSEVKSAYT